MRHELTIVALLALALAGCGAPVTTPVAGPTRTLLADENQQPQEVQAKDFEAKDVQAKDVQAKDVQATDVQAKDVQPKDVQAKDIQAKDEPAACAAQAEAVKAKDETDKVTATEDKTTDETIATSSQPQAPVRVLSPGETQASATSSAHRYAVMADRRGRGRKHVHHGKFGHSKWWGSGRWWGASFDPWWWGRYSVEPRSYVTVGDLYYPYYLVEGLVYPDYTRPHAYFRNKLLPFDEDVPVIDEVSIPRSRARIIKA